MKAHRTVTLIVMLVLGVAAVALLLTQARVDTRSLASLAVVVVGAAVGGIALSWKRYGRARRP